MNIGDIPITFTYDLIGLHLLIRIPKHNVWMLVDMEEIHKKTGKSIEEVLDMLIGKKKKEQ